MKTQPIGHPDRNWPEGDYLCSCVDCKLPFTGHKRQPTCRKCAKPPTITFEGREDEMLTFHKDGKYWLTLNSPGPKEAAELERWLNTRTPTPTVWHRASEKLPTEKDGDYAGSVWVLSDGEVFREPLASVRVRVREGECVSWTKTNFTKPKPPEV